MIPLSSNTWKMEALFDLAGYAETFSNLDIERALDEGGFLMNDKKLETMSTTCRTVISDSFFHLKQQVLNKPSSAKNSPDFKRSIRSFFARLK